MIDFSQLNLARFPQEEAANLRAWDTADQYLLNRIGERDLLNPGLSVLVANDRFGALSVALARAGAAVTFWNDSKLSFLALGQNLATNGVPWETLGYLPADLSPSPPADLVVMRVPKNLAWFQDSLLRLRPVLEPGAQVLAGSMIKHTSLRAYSLLEECIGPTRTSLGWKKARLAEAQFHPGLDCPENLPRASYRVEDFDLTLHNNANVFSREKLDFGTRFLLDHLPVMEGEPRVVDLACGNGVLALAVKRRCPGAEIMGIDESYQAISCALDNAMSNRLDVDFQVGCDLGQVELGSRDLVLCNPPFHQDRSVGDHTARALFQQAHEALKVGGELRLVGNRHLGYPTRLTELFGGCRLIAENDKFAVLSAIKA